MGLQERRAGCDSRSRHIEKIPGCREKYFFLYLSPMKCHNLWLDLAGSQEVLTAPDRPSHAFPVESIECQPRGVALQRSGAQNIKFSAVRPTVTTFSKFHNLGAKLPWSMIG